MWASSNPALNNQDAFSQFYGKEMFATRSNVTTLQGVVNKTGILVGITILAGAGGYALSASMPQILWISAIASLVICLGIYFVLAGKPQLSPVVAPIYAVVEGVFLGAFTALADDILKARGMAAAGGVGAQAFIITAAVLVSMLGLYKAGVIRATPRLRTVVVVATGGIMLAYLISFAMIIFTGRPMPLISTFAAVNDTGMMAFIGLGINVFILGIASLWLVIDFAMIEEKVEQGAPKYMEWYCGFALLVTLAWIYFESVKLVLRISSLLNSRS